MDKEDIGMTFSKNLFWDIDPATLDVGRHRKYLVARVLEHGTLADWQQLVRGLGLEAIVAAAQSLRTLDPKAVTFLSALAGVPKETFRCYDLRLSNPTPWNS
jgi:hypothetical protein